MSNQHYHPPIIDTAETTKSLWSSAKTANAIAVAGIGSLSLQGDYNATTNTPDLVTPVGGTVFKGYFWVVTVAGTFFGEVLEIGDSLISKIDDPSALSDWIRVEKNKDTETLAETLLAGNTSGANDILMDDTQQVRLGTTVTQYIKNLDANRVELGVNRELLIDIGASGDNALWKIDDAAIIGEDDLFKVTVGIQDGTISWLDKTTSFLSILDANDLLTASRTWKMPDVGGTVVVDKQYATTYFVSSDTGDDTNTGLSGFTAFATLEAALDAGEAGAVPYGVIIQDNNTYTPQAAIGTRTSTIEFSIFGPLANLEGPAGGLVWSTNLHRIDMCCVTGIDLTFRPASTFQTIVHKFDKIVDPNTLYYSSGAGDATYIVQCTFSDMTSDATLHYGNICDINNGGRLELKGKNIYNQIDTGAPISTLFKGSGVNTELYVTVDNCDLFGSLVNRSVIDISGSATGYITCQHSSNSVFGVVDGASSRIYAVNVYSSTGTPETYTETNSGRVYSSSPMEGFNWNSLDATSGLALTDTINVRDNVTNEQVSATLTQLQTIISTTPTLAEVITEGNATGSLMKVTDSEKIQFGNNLNNFIGNLDGSSVYIGVVNLLRFVFSGGANSDCWDFRVDTLLGDNALFSMTLNYTDGTIQHTDKTTGFVGLTNMSTITASQTWTMPDKTGTVALTSDITGSTIVSKVFGDSPYTAAVAQMVICDATGGAMTINLPAAASSTNDEITVKKTDASVNTVTIDGNAAELIDGALTKIISLQYDSVTVKSDGVSWWIK